MVLLLDYSQVFTAFLWVCAFISVNGFFVYLSMGVGLLNSQQSGLLQVKWASFTSKGSPSLSVRWIVTSWQLISELHS